MQTNISHALRAGALLSLAFCGLTARAEIISVQFGCTAGSSCDGDTHQSTPQQTGAAVIGSAGDDWNLVSGNSGLGASGAANSLSNTAGATTGVSVSWSSDTGWNAIGDSSFASTPYQNLMSSYMDIHSGDSGYIDLAGLVAGRSYQLYVYSEADKGSNGREAQFSVNGGTGRHGGGFVSGRSAVAPGCGAAENPLGSGDRPLPHP